LYEHLAGSKFTSHKYLEKQPNPKFINNFYDRLDVNESTSRANEQNISMLFIYLQNHPNCQDFENTSKQSRGFSYVRWNFTKFLVGRDGVPIKRFGHMQTPFSLEEDVSKALGGVCL